MSPNPNRIKVEMHLTREIEGCTFAITRGTYELDETPGRIGFYVVSEHGSSVKLYFDNTRSLEELANLATMAQSMAIQADFGQV